MHRLGDVDIRLLRVFKAVVECGGFSAAEVELNIGRSAISTHMADLEQRLGMRLCERGRSGFALTEHGRKAYEQTLILLAALESFRTRMSACRDSLIGDLNLGVADSTLTDPGARLPQIVDSFRARGPEVYIGLQVASPNELERAVLDGRLHLAIVPVHHRLPGLDYRPLYRERSFLYCSAVHPLFGIADERLDLDALARHDFVTPGYVQSPQVRELYRPLHAAATAYQMEGLATLVLSGRYIGFLPDHYAEVWIRKRTLRPLLVQRMHFVTEFAAIGRKGAASHPVLDAFVEEMTRAYHCGPAAG